MVDTRTPQQRRAIMQAVKQKGTGPEMVVRRLLHSMGFRYRLHVKNLPGTPDLVFRSRKKVVFVHGCFWHGHGCTKGQLPKSRLDYWLPKIEANKARDSKNLDQLRELGWTYHEVWQCELRDLETLSARLIQFLSNGEASSCLPVES